MLETDNSQMLTPLGDFLNELGDLTPASFAALILIAFNLVLRATPEVPNRLIPWLSIALGMFLFPYYLPMTTTFDNPLGRNIGLGFLVGVGASYGYQSIVKFAENKMPWLHEILNNNGKGKHKNEKRSKGSGSNGVSGNHRNDDRIDHGV